MNEIPKYGCYSWNSFSYKNISNLNVKIWHWWYVMENISIMGKETTIFERNARNFTSTIKVLLTLRDCASFCCSDWKYLGDPAPFGQTFHLFSEKRWKWGLFGLKITHELELTAERFLLLLRFARIHQLEVGIFVVMNVVELGSRSCRRSVHSFIISVTWNMSFQTY